MAGLIKPTDPGRCSFRIGYLIYRFFNPPIQEVLMGILDKVTEKLNWRKVKILGGDLQAGDWDFNGGMMTADPATGNSECVPLCGEIKKLSIQTQESSKDLAKTLGLTIAGGILFGPLGAIGGYFAGGDRKSVCVLVELKDGRKFLAVMDQRIYQQVLGFSMNHASFDFD
jgi:hypothetical protein